MCLAPLSAIFHLYRGGHFIGGRNRSTWRKQRPVASHWQTLSHNVIWSTPCLSGIRTNNIRRDRH